MGSNNTANLLISNFKTFLEAYDRNCPFTKNGQLKYHIETIRHRRNFGSAEGALKDESFQKSLYRTLTAWGIGSRRSILRPFPHFVEALQAKAAEIQELDGLAIDQADLDISRVADKLARLIQSLDIVSNKVRIVPGSKALHHVLPELVVPIDREYTQKRFFEWSDYRLQNSSEQCFIDAFNTFVKIARATNPAQYIRDGWHTSRTKVIDNAVVGLWCSFKAKFQHEDQHTK
jgi:hypothetical protein